MGKFTIEGILINHDEQFEGRIEINTETHLIEKVGKPQGNADLKAGDSLIFPGFVDLHVHAREDISNTQSYKENFLTMSKAALHGGVVCVGDMPNNLVAPVNDARYHEKEILAKTSLIDVVLYGGIGPETSPLSFPVPYKVFMGPSIGDLYFTSKAQLEQSIARYQGQNISFHCEDPEILERNKGQESHELQRPRKAEIEAVDFALFMIEKYDLQGKLCHCSTKEAIEKVAQVKKKGLKVSCEVTPHHLYFDETMLSQETRPWLQVNPPLRTREDRLALVQGLRDGTINFLASDHAPHKREEKLKGISGIPHLDTYGICSSWLMKVHNFSPSDIARICSWNPGRFLQPFLKREYGRGFGRIEEGYVGSLTILNPNTPTIIEMGKLKTKCAWSPFEGMEFPGKVEYTVIKGKAYKQQ